MANIHLEIVLTEGKNLKNSLDESAYLDVTSLKIKGRFTFEDIDLLSEFKNLQVLDLSSALPDTLAEGEWHRGLVGMPSLEKVIIPTNALYFDDSIFDNCLALKEISGKAKRYDSRYEYDYYTKDGVFYKKDRKKGLKILVKYPICKNDGQFILDCDEIRIYAFKNAKVNTIISKRNQAPLCSPTAFDGVDVSQISLLVPKGSYYNYKYAKVWKDFLIREWEITDPSEE